MQVLGQFMIRITRYLERQGVIAKEGEQEIFRLFSVNTELSAIDSAPFNSVVKSYSDSAKTQVAEILLSMRNRQS